MEREACVCDHGFERSDLCAEIIIIIRATKIKIQKSFQISINSEKNEERCDTVLFIIYQQLLYVVDEAKSPKGRAILYLVIGTAQSTTYFELRCWPTKESV